MNKLSKKIINRLLTAIKPFMHSIFYITFGLFLIVRYEEGEGYMARGGRVTCDV
jgi:hypothetical protein